MFRYPSANRPTPATPRNFRFDIFFPAMARASQRCRSLASYRASLTPYDRVLGIYNQHYSPWRPTVVSRKGPYSIAPIAGAPRGASSSDSSNGGPRGPRCHSGASPCRVTPLLTSRTGLWFTHVRPRGSGSSVRTPTLCD